MYWAYKSSSNGAQRSFSSRTGISLFGCNSGRLVEMLRTKLKAGACKEKWDLDLDAMAWPSGEALVIDLKPDQQQLLSLYQICHVWGWSEAEWTPLMLVLRGLSVDGDAGIKDPADFSVVPNPLNEHIVTFLYLNGGIHDGQLVGRWTPASPSPTNSALLWPPTFRWFRERFDAFERAAAAIPNLSDRLPA